MSCSCSTDVPTVAGNLWRPPWQSRLIVRIICGAICQYLMMPDPAEQSSDDRDHYRDRRREYIAFAGLRTWNSELKERREALPAMSLRSFMRLRKIDLRQPMTYLQWNLLSDLKAKRLVRFDLCQTLFRPTKPSKTWFVRLSLLRRFRCLAKSSSVDML